MTCCGCGCGCGALSGPCCCGTSSRPCCSGGGCSSGHQRPRCWAAAVCAISRPTSSPAHPLCCAAAPPDRAWPLPCWAAALWATCCTTPRTGRCTRAALTGCSPTRSRWGRDEGQGGWELGGGVLAWAGCRLVQPHAQGGSLGGGGSSYHSTAAGCREVECGLGTQEASQGGSSCA